MTQRTIQSQKFGSAPEATTAAANVTAKSESGTLVVANPGRVALYVTNNGAKDVWLALGTPAVAEKGIKLAEKTGATVIDNYSGIVTCITKEGESVVSLSEV